jgi:hypothetical protein
MELAAELALGAELDVDALVEAEPDEIQRLLHRHVLLRRHGCRQILAPFSRFVIWNLNQRSLLGPCLGLVWALPFVVRMKGNALLGIAHLHAKQEVAQTFK